MTVFAQRSSVMCFIVVIVYLLSAVSAEARTVVRSGDLVSVTDEQTIEGDFYTAARKLNVSGVVTEDVVAAAQEVSINGSIGDNAFLIADEADIFGSVGDDLRVIARNVTIAEPVAGDVFVVGGTVRISSTASIAGDVLIYAGEAVIEGAVGGDVLGTVETLRIDSAVAGNVDIATSQLTLGDRAAIEGSVSYESNDLLVQSPNALIGGDLLRNDPVVTAADASIRMFLVPTLVLMFSVLVWYLVARKSLQATVQTALTRSPRPLLIGLAVVLFAPVAAVILISSVIGALVGIVVLFLYLLLFIAGLIVTTAVAGQLAMRVIHAEAEQVSLVTVSVGVVLVTLCLWLPIVGPLALIILLVLAMGAMADLLFRSQH